MRKMGHWTGTCSNCGGQTSRRNVTCCRKCRDVARRSLSVTSREYRRGWHLTKKYSIDAIDFECLWIAFAGKCGICGCDMEMPQNRRGQSPRTVAVDHDHVTGNVRGLLCNRCNKGLGMFEDNIEHMKNAIKWLEMSNEKTSNNSRDPRN